MHCFVVFGFKDDRCARKIPASLSSLSSLGLCGVWVVTTDVLQSVAAAASAATSLGLRLELTPGFAFGLEDDTVRKFVPSSSSLGFLTRNIYPEVKKGLAKIRFGASRFLLSEDLVSAVFTEFCVWLYGISAFAAEFLAWLSFG